MREREGRELRAESRELRGERRGKEREGEGRRGKERGEGGRVGYLLQGDRSLGKLNIELSIVVSQTRRRG